MTKTKTLFDHLNALTWNKEIKWNSLTQEDKKSFSVYMINRYLSMNQNFIPYIAKLQFMTQSIEPEFVYRFYQELLPKSKVFLKYIKGKKIKHYAKEVYNYLIQYFECSMKEVEEYLEILDWSEIKTILKKYGINDEDIKKWKSK